MYIYIEIKKTLKSGDQFVVHDQMHLRGKRVSVVKSFNRVAETRVQMLGAIYIETNVHNRLVFRALVGT